MATPALSEPVFVHAWWRSSSTWLWAKLRQNDALCCYYEPLHERLATLAAQEVRGRVNAAALGHPGLDRHYFAEFEPLLASGDLGFNKDLAYERYLLRAGEPDEALEAYLGRLVAAARRLGKRPVLCFCRSSLRAAWMKERCGGVHVAQIRGVRGQWRSFVEQWRRRRDPYFLGGMVAIAAKLGARFPGVWSHLAVELPDLRAERYRPEELEHFSRLAAALSFEQAYGLFALLWLASTLQVLGVADVVLDAERLTRDAEMREEIAARLAQHGLPVDLSDCSVPAHRPAPQAQARFAGSEDAAIAAVGTNARALLITRPERARQALRHLEPHSAELLERVLAAAERS